MPINLHSTADLIALAIVEEFENLLEQKGIVIPNKERGDPDSGIQESCIYGDDYYQLEDRVKSILVQNGI